MISYNKLRELLIKLAENNIIQSDYNTRNELIIKGEDTGQTRTIHINPEYEEYKEYLIEKLKEETGYEVIDHDYEEILIHYISIKEVINECFKPNPYKVLKELLDTVSFKKGEFGENLILVDVIVQNSSEVSKEYKDIVTLIKNKCFFVEED